MRWHEAAVYLSVTEPEALGTGGEFETIPGCARLISKWRRIQYHDETIRGDVHPIDCKPIVGLEATMRRHPQVPMILVLAIWGAGTLVWSQGQAPPSPLPEQQAQVQEGPSQVWSPDQLDNLVAPIALYPDPLLGQMLVACTYPLEIVEASQWLQRNRNLRGQALVDPARHNLGSQRSSAGGVGTHSELKQEIRWTHRTGECIPRATGRVIERDQRMRPERKAMATFRRRRANGYESGGRRATESSLFSGRRTGDLCAFL